VGSGAAPDSDEASEAQQEDIVLDDADIDQLAKEKQQQQDVQAMEEQAVKEGANSGLPMQDEETYNYLSQRNREELIPLISKLNKLPEIVVSGGLGQCFNCRNKDIQYEDQHYYLKSELSPRQRELRRAM